MYSTLIVLDGGLFLNKNDKKSFSTANVFFICTVGTLMLKYFYNCWQDTVQMKPIFSNIMLISMSAITIIWLIFKFPLFVKVDEDINKLSFYENIYSKNLNFWSRLYLIFFEFTKPSKIISLFSTVCLKLGVNNRDCKFVYVLESPQIIHRFLDMVLTMVFSVVAFFITEEITKFGFIFGVLLYMLVMLIVYKKVLLNYIYSVNIDKVNGYNLNVVYPYNIFDGIFSRLYGLAYDMNRTILLSKQIFCGGENLKKYIIAHEEGHLATKCPKKTLLITITFVFASFFGIAGPCIASEIFPSIEWVQWFLAISYIIFILLFNKIINKKNKDEEFAADIFAIKKIGKEMVLKGLKIIKDDKLYVDSTVELTGTEIDRRIKFVEKYEGA